MDKKTLPKIKSCKCGQTPKEGLLDVGNTRPGEKFSVACKCGYCGPWRTSRRKAIEAHNNDLKK